MNHIVSECSAGSTSKLKAAVGKWRCSWTREQGGSLFQMEGAEFRKALPTAILCVRGLPAKAAPGSANVVVEDRAQDELISKMERNV